MERLGHLMISFFSFRRAVLVSAFGAFFLLSGLSVTPSFSQNAASGNNDFCEALLKAHPKGGAGLEAEVKTLVAAAPDVAEDVLGCAGGANKAQAKALGAGLAQFVADIKGSDPALADKIAALVAASDNKVLKTAFDGGDGGDQTAAIDDGGDGGADNGGTVDVAESGPAAPTLVVGSSGGGTGGGAVSPN